MDSSKPHYRLIGTEMSLFTAKARAYLNWKGLPFTEVLASREVYKHIIKPLTHTAIIPILLLPTSPPTALQDTHHIIRHLESLHPSTPHPCLPPTPRRFAASNLLELLSDQWLLLQSMYWRWAPRSAPHRAFILSEFGHTNLGGAKSSFEERLARERETEMKFYTMLPGLGIDEVVGEGLEKQFRVLLGMLERLTKEWRFLLGDRVTVADFGVFGDFYAHLLRDPVSGFIIRTEFPVVNEWIERVQGLGRGGSWRTEVYDSATGSFTIDYPATATPMELADELPEALQPFLNILLDDYLPILLDSANRVAKYLASGKGKKAGKEGWVVVPRGLGRHEFWLNPGDGKKVKGVRNVMTHGVWMMMRCVEEVRDEKVWAEVIGWAGCDKKLWEEAVGVMRPWEFVREDGLYLARKRVEAVEARL
ncbi:hypothetical protein EX30DRAFT_396334 [Ascodesmis nigricans]|uniref:GST N-terminal domain-containing protein n=1 Tax=Ascodesmis nigricans TaxID=341454 RepID=A0A4S2MUX5_9PEZI|nr:hypothetical protein EX30DRAFT_396334 [Ascodesmis nigricans]